jgi:hypothetical protein
MPLELQNVAVSLARIDGEVLVLVAIVSFVAISLAVLSTVRKTVEIKHREETRREVAAYVAEGSIKPEDAAILLGVGETDELEKKIADAVAWGTIRPEKADQLIRTLRNKPSGPGAASAPQA